MGMNRRWIIEYYRLSDSTCTDPSSFKSVFYCCCMWTVQLVLAVFNLDISFICWFRDVRVFFCDFWDFYSWRSWWSRRQRVRRYHNSCMYRHSWKLFFFLLKKSPQFACFTIVAFFPCSCSPEMLDYQDFQIVGCRIKGILLYIM